MKLKKIINITIIFICVSIIMGIAAFIYNARNSYNISKDFISVPLNFNPDDSSSSYQMQNAQITVYGGFIKGIQKGKGGTESLIIRALSPLPSVTVLGNNTAKISLLIENVNPDFYAKSIAGSNLPSTKQTVNTLQLNIAVNTGETVNIKPIEPATADSQGKSKYIILGDNRDGYNTFGQIIDQVNGQNPVFVIDNGDLVFSGKPNQYRLFDKMVTKISATVCTTLGNHDIRSNGRNIYTKLYGPAYYSFDFADSHFVFLDSSPGWVEKTAISDEQYIWLEKDLAKAQGKRIFVITHIPPEDPRSDTNQSEIPNYNSQSGSNKLEEKLNNISEDTVMAHGFNDPEEAAKFENLMSKYHVDTVYLSHIHSYFEYTKDGVRYMITGGAGAELLSKNSYYHYIIADFGERSNATVVELPSPPNNSLARYVAAAQLFISAMYDENPMTVILIAAGFVLLIVLLIVKLYLKRKKPLDTLFRWIGDTAKFSVKHFKELFSKNVK